MSTATTKTSSSTSPSSTPVTKGVSSVHNILKILSSRLGSKGNIKDSKDVVFITELMREAVKLVDKCMFLNVLLETRNADTLSTMLNSGGWTVLHSWLLHSKADDSRTFLVELLKLYKQLPVTVELLRQNSCAKDIKQLSKYPDTKIAGLSKSIISCWMDKVKEKSTSSSSSSTGLLDATKHSDKSSSHSDNMQNHRSSSKLSLSSSKTSSTLKDKDSEDTDPSRVKTLCDSPDHISAKLNQHMLSADHTSSVTSSVASDETISNNNTESAPPRTASQRPKTVKTLGSKMRSTGLEVEDPLPPSKKKSQLQSFDKIPSKPPSNKKSVPEKKSTVATTTSVTTSSTSPSIAAKAKPKVIAPRPRAQEIFESSGFMDALSSTDVILGRRKRKISALQTVKPNTSTATVVPPSPEDKKPQPPSFYRETMEVSDDMKPSSTDDSKSTSVDSAGTDEVAAVTNINDVEMKTEEGASSVQQEEMSNEDSSSTYSSSEPATKKKKVKRVSWVDESKLCSYFYFQLDESERVNVNRAKDFAEIRKHEQEMERQVMQNVRRMAHDTMTEKQEWRKPRLITGLSLVTVPGCNSKERDVQREREQSVLLVLYFNKNSIPDSAGEPEPEYYELSEPRIIPLNDETGLGSEINYETYTTTSTASTTQASTQLPPAIANLLASTSQQATNTNVPSTQANNANPPTMPVAAPSSSAPLLRQLQPTPPPQCNVPPLPVFLSMPLSLQQQIFQSVPVHIQQQMLSSLPPPLQNQLGPLVGSSAPNNTPPFPDGVNPATNMAPPAVIPPTARPPGPGPLLNFARRPTGPPPFVAAPGPDAARPQRPPRAMRGPPPPQSGRVCSHFLAGNCRYGATCRKVHPARDVGSAAAAVSPSQQESPR